MDQYEGLLSKISENGKDISPYKPLSEYNIFNVLEINAREVLMCRFLADLLNPEGQHLCGILFLKSFFQEILKENCPSDSLLAHTDVRKEFVIEHDRRIDIVISSADFLMPVEVKIYGEEQEGQCYAYFERAQNAPLVYLTRFGEPPSEYSRKQKGGTELLPLDKVKCISWSEDICGWLAGLLIQLKEPLKSVVEQYIDSIHLIADVRERKVMEKNLEVLLESPEYFCAGIEIEKTMKTAKLRLLRLLFDDFREEMEPLTARYGLKPETDFLYYSYEEKRHEKFYDCYSTYPGLNYVVKNAKFSQTNLQMWFRIEVEHNLFAGFVLFDTEAPAENEALKGYQVNEITGEMLDEAARYLDREVIKPADWWLTYCYSNGKRQDDDYDDVPNFKTMNQCATALVDQKTRKEFVKNAVKVFENQILKYLRNV